MPNVLKVPELAELLRIGRTAAYQLVNSGEIRTIRVGRVIRVPMDAVEEFLSAEANETSPMAEAEQ